MRRRTVLQALGATAALSAPAIAQPGKARTLRFVPQSNLPTLDPIFLSEVVANPGFYVFDTLYSADSRGSPSRRWRRGTWCPMMGASGASASATG